MTTQPCRISRIPWAVTENARERTIQIDTADGRGTVVNPGAISWKPDAHFIVRACNVHEVLVKALGDALDLLVCDSLAETSRECPADELCDVCQVKATARDAIRRATAAA